MSFSSPPSCVGMVELSKLAMTWKFSESDDICPSCDGIAPVKKFPARPSSSATFASFPSSVGTLFDSASLLTVN